MKNGGGIRFLDKVMSLGVVVLGGWLVYSSQMNQELNAQFLDLIKNTPLYSLALGLFLILSVILRMVSGRRPREKDRFINFEADGGSVGVSTKAIRDFIEQICKEFSAVKSIDSKLIQDKNALDVDINLRVASGNKIPELSRMIQLRVRESVRESLGLEEIRNITIKVQEIVGAPPVRDGSEFSE